MAGSTATIAAIMRGDMDNDLDALMDALVARRRNVGRQRAAAVASETSIGDRVRLMGISPKGLDGATGTVKGIRKTRVEVEIDKEFAPVAGRFSAQISMGLPLGVPMSCVTPA